MARYRLVPLSASESLNKGFRRTSAESNRVRSSKLFGVSTGFE
jgi:hypothetical protein